MGDIIKFIEFYMGWMNIIILCMQNKNQTKVSHARYVWLVIELDPSDIVILFEITLSPL